MKNTDAGTTLEGFIAKYSPEVASLARAALDKMGKRLPSAVQLVYDNYNALAIGFGPTARASDAVFSIALWPRWVSLFFVSGAHLADPSNLLKGSGTRARHIVLQNVAMLDDVRVRALMAQALDQAGTSLKGARRGHIVIKSVSARQRPRRPTSSAGPSRQHRDATAHQSRRPNQRLQPSALRGTVKRRG